MMRRLWSTSLLAVAVVVTACSDATPPTAADDTGGVQARVGQGTGEYIVVFRDGVQDVPGLARQLTGAARGELGYTYQHAIRGFSARMPAAALNGLRNHPLVEFIEADQPVSAFVTQTNATWGLDRIDQRDRPLNGTYVYEADGSGVRAYIIDTGIRPSHNDFGGRVAGGFTAINDGRGTTDCNGHGTHVAGTVGGTTWGVAKKAQLIPVRVLNCQGNGTTAGVIAGVDWVTANHVKPAVANMSLGGGASTALDAAVANAVSAGVTMVVAAGNDNANACNYSPARAASAITVGATTSSDARASYSNYGSCLDLFAPGSSITSAWYTNNSATSTISGTSMASPHVAGVAALYLQQNPSASPSSVANAIVGNSTTGKVTSAGSNSPNRLLYSGFIGGGGSENMPPTASFSFSCTGLTCTFDGGASSDPDGSIVSYAWNFGDGSNGSGVTPSKTYSSAGTRTVTLTVTDNAGATASTQRSVTTTAPGSSISLTVRTSKVRGVNSANLSWSGAAGTVDVYRGSQLQATVSGTTYVDEIGRGSGSVSYRVCNAGTSTCSNTVTANY